MNYDSCPVLGPRENPGDSAIGNGSGAGRRERLPGGGDTCALSMRGRNGKMDLGEVEEECLWRGNGTHKKAPRPETS